ncbi:hypothetical protein [Sinanaerobacter chloroacetimidivorans]|uniref:Uncharacterized protein n=1 Tax=Sinanaerobacter chloroacetimidivorans TaxID=2818044 RepID=A0A8J8B225_9FIRM|nr:hypothetical protein [Sinanaerobacter chloroacetimidivorans]MBR0598301.1 hypothetical protein [Sinanaerobacter chloroacetimidivorans]
MFDRFQDFHSKINADEALKGELQDLKNKVFLGSLTEKEQLAYLETALIPFAKRMGIDFTIEEIEHFIEKQKGIDDFQEDDKFIIPMTSLADVIRHLLDEGRKEDEKEKKEE